MRARCLVAVVVVLTACGGADRTAVVDLLRLFPFTAAGQTVARIDFGTPAADALLRAGWSTNETLPDGTSGAWAIARRATVQLTIAAPADGRLVMRCGLLAEGAPRMALLNVTLNGHRLGLVRVGRGLAEHPLRLPARFERAGTNVLQIANALLTVLPRRAGRERARAVAFDWIALDGVNAAPRAALDTGASPTALVLPPSAGVDFFVRLPPAATLAAEIDPAGATTARLDVTLEVDGAAAETVARVTSPAKLALPLRGPPGAVARVTLAASGGGAVRVVRPTILGSPAAERPPPAPGGGRPNVVVYLVDTLRADHLGCYGHGPPTSPHVDALAADGVLFANHRAQASWTLPATASIMTGLDPLVHGAVSLASPIRKDAVTLAEVLRAHGYRTAGFVTNVNVRGDLGFRRGFDTYTYLPEDERRPTVHVPAGELVEHAVAWLTHVPADAPFFLYVHATDPHRPYRPPPEVAALVRPPGAPPPIADADDPLRELMRLPAARTPENVAWLESLYDGDVRVADEGLGALVRALHDEGRYDGTLLVVTADHGEEFLEHGGFQHGHTVYRELLAVPLVVHLPGARARGERIERPSRQIDLLPTILDEVGLPVPDGVRGESLLAVAAGNPAPRESYAHTSLGPAEVLGLTGDGWKAVQKIGRLREVVEIYDLARDPGEQVDRAGERPVLVGYGRQSFARLENEAPRTSYGEHGSSGTVDAATARRLKALGYVEH